MFEELGFRYIGPVDGHDIDELISIFNKIKDLKGPIIIHTKTIKGKGYRFAEKLPWQYHGVGEFDIKTGKTVKKQKNISYSKVFGDTITALAENNNKIVAVSAAMVSGTGLENFKTKYPDRMFDVGIAEQHAVTFSAGMAIRGFIPFFAVYSTFLQRAYDEILHDVCLQKLHVILAIDRAGIVGADGETHQGIFDISFIAHMPNIVFMAPSNGTELKSMIIRAAEMDCPVAIRYPRESIPEKEIKTLIDIEIGKAETINEGNKIAIICCGTMIEKCQYAFDKLKTDGYNPMFVNARFIKPLDIEMVKNVCSKCDYVFTVEDNVLTGGFGSIFKNAVNAIGFKNFVYSFGFDDKFIEQGTREQLFEANGIDGEGIYKKIKAVIGRCKNG